MSCGRETRFSDFASEKLSDLTPQSINPSIIQALCHFRSISEEKGPTAKTLTEGQNCFTTKDTKSTKELEYEALDPALKLGDIAQPITAFDSSLSSILRVLHALRGEFSSTSGLALQPARVLCEPKLEITIYSKRHGPIIQLFNLKLALEN